MILTTIIEDFPNEVLKKLAFWLSLCSKLN